MTPNEAADAVRAYLLFLENPDSLRDEEALAEAQRAVDAATDPLDKLAALAAHERLSSVDGEHVRREFIQHARAYASQHNIPASAFSALGVSPVDLRDAGLVSTSRPSRKRQRRVGQNEVREVARSMTEAFSVRMLAEASATTLQTATKVVKAMEAEGTLVLLGSNRQYEGRGKPPRLYRLS